MPCVSYVVTVYNKVPVLPFLLAGLAAQQGDFSREFIFVDDGSTDDSGALLRRLTAGWQAVTIVSQANGGPAVAFNAGLRRARGDYIKPMDADDVLLPWGTRRLLDAIEATGCAVAFGLPTPTYDIASTPEAVLSVFPHRPGPVERCDNMIRRSLRGAQTNPSTWLARADAVRRSGGCDERVFIQDYSLELRLAALGGFACLHEMIVRGPAAAPGRLNDNQAQILHDVNRALAYFIADHPGLPPGLARRAFARAASRAWRWARRHGGKGLASPEFRRFCGARLGLLAATHANLLATCGAFAETNTIRVPAVARTILA
ncbi:MAG TPA: glycosyltransferase family 2 protein [Stellaceae bacterium]|nr:glycosyltransferase family 2 protein [Stellaceae bacterium]